MRAILTKAETKHLVSLVLYLMHRLYYRNKFTRVRTMKTIYLLDRETYRKYGIRLIDLHYKNMFYGPHAPEVINALEDLVEEGALHHLDTVYRYGISNVDILRRYAKDCKNMIRVRADELGIDYYRLAKTLGRVVRKCALATQDKLLLYVLELPEVRNVPLGGEIVLEQD